ncbi:MAG: hypothetical protein CFE26_14540 [Verrucomicrobiales bacterium VVV1]|nr:MAG: hypothetical protein CFE26_14540 [Verrucomicrobiales bacterium VVV1]
MVERPFGKRNFSGSPLDSWIAGRSVDFRTAENTEFKELTDEAWNLAVDLNPIPAPHDDLDSSAFSVSSAPLRRKMAAMITSFDL